jgi:hypothetical protein
MFAELQFLQFTELTDSTDKPKSEFGNFSSQVGNAHAVKILLQVLRFDDLSTTSSKTICRLDFVIGVRHPILDVVPHQRRSMLQHNVFGHLIGLGVCMRSAFHRRM